MATTDDILDGLVDQLASIEHERWAHWQRYVHSKSLKQPDGSMLLPAELVAQWERQINTPFERLSDKEKDSDREQVQKYLPFLKAALLK
ncbi:hypothetical protein ELI54_30005 (plasmid) [Rhizobium ruizarguesonis]|jgi:hypothetical protein|uniref:hypothetical protein n=1 Tax=Rhizobium ruizarguesonis TaxID=2081791 RepID=UPI001030DBF4|nr:hypothetical protein [Rhizobium ruizarguesonis]MBY5879411.1 hypothetical protein [Rhizobium leguminosarum]TAT72149.1 hypothetical protein ELI56_31215 [Rhizobium ruizarguesonis]TAT75799.1 hypothetical protein ELI54_30005 [Rhizobium ruizarguesonis]TAZ67741.1 hypothetical protein ELH70_29690 [Rhizobium ruizarguesonis]TAZ89049.1 hypothetical protein ELH69_33805 [Rhizobium ruizarguesonis]